MHGNQPLMLTPAQAHRRAREMSAFCVAMHANCIALSPERRRPSLFLADHVSDAGVHFPYALAHAPGACLHGGRRADRVQHASAASAYVLTCQYLGRVHR